jgi:hypothetical protein
VIHQEVTLYRERVGETEAQLQLAKRETERAKKIGEAAMAEAAAAKNLVGAWQREVRPPPGYTVMCLMRIGPRGRGRFAIPAECPLHDCSPCRGLHVPRERLGFVHRSRSFSASPQMGPIRKHNQCPPARPVRATRSHRSPLPPHGPRRDAGAVAAARVARGPQAGGAAGEGHQGAAALRGGGARGGGGVRAAAHGRTTRGGAAGGDTHNPPHTLTPPPATPRSCCTRTHYAWRSSWR